VSASGPTIALPRFHPGQQYVYDHRKRFTLLDAGRRWRKTTYTLSVEVLEALRRRGDYLYTAPTYKQVRVPWMELKNANRTGHISFNESRMEAILPNGSMLHFVSLDDPDNARGLTAMGIVIDEYADVSDAAWNLVLSPMLADTGGWAIKAGTPKGRNHFYREFTAATNGDLGPDYAAFCAPTRGVKIVGDRIALDALGRPIYDPHPLENPFVPFAEIVKLYQQIPERSFRQEILAEFLLDGGGVFRNARALIDPSIMLLQRPPTGYKRYSVGVDLAKHQDYTVIVVFDLDERRVVAFQRWNHETWPLIKARIALAAKTWNDALVYLDSTGLGDPIYDDLQRAGLRIQSYHFTEGSRAALIEHTILATEQRLYRLPADPALHILLSEMEAMEYRESPSHRLRPDHPPGLHDDTVWALALALWPMSATGSLPQAALSSLQGDLPLADIVNFERIARANVREALGRRL
jgi:Terminase RNaseH-like domain/Terminase large subunit, T4likevirus-type, N-terminal